MSENSTEGPHEDMNDIDAAWGLLCAFLIFTMQTGFALLEAGCVSAKNVTNIMMKNCIDAIMGALAYWIFGYALSFGKPANAFCGYGNFLFQSTDSYYQSGSRSAQYFFQLSFATTSTTIVSGSIAERMKLHSYIIYSFINVIPYAISASWAWNTDIGFLSKLGYFDYAGSSVVHLSGGVAALVCCVMLGPRLQRFTEPDKFSMSSPITALTGTFMLWWAWLGFNAGSTFAVSGHWWRIGAIAAVNTLNGSVGGGLVGMILSMVIHRKKILVDYLIGSILGGLVAVTGIAAVTTTWESLIIGAIGGAIAIGGMHLLLKLKVDDVVGAVPVHCFAATWGTLAVGLFGKDNPAEQLRGRSGLFRSGSPYLLGVQLLGACVIASWSAVWNAVMVLLLTKTIGFRMSKEEEIIGADWAEHSVRSVTLTSRLEAAIRAITSDDHFDAVIENLVREMVKKPRMKTASLTHRAFTIDNLEDVDEKDNAAIVEHDLVDRFQRAVTARKASNSGTVFQRTSNRPATAQSAKLETNQPSNTTTNPIKRLFTSKSRKVSQDQELPESPTTSNGEEMTRSTSIGSAF